MKFVALNDRVIVCPEEPQTVTQGGIYIPDISTEKPVIGTVTSVGPGAPDQRGVMLATIVKVGQKVLYGQWSGTEMKIDGKRHLVMREGDLLAVVEA